MVLSVTASEVSFSVPDSSPTDSASSLPSLNTSVAHFATASSLSPSSYSQGAGSSPGSVSSVYYSSSASASNYSYGAGTYSISIPSVYSSSASTAAGTTYTSTYTYVMTRCGAPGVMNCPATYQSEVVVTRTTTICPSTATTAIASTGITVVPIPAISSKPAGPNHSGGEVVVIVLTPLPTPVVATFVPPTETTTVHVKDYTETAKGQSTTTATTTSTTATTAIASHSGFQTPALLIVPSPSLSPSANVPGNATVVGTGFIPGATQSGGSPPSSQTPVIAGAGRSSGFSSAYGAYLGAAVTFVIALFMRVL